MNTISALDHDAPQQAIVKWGREQIATLGVTLKHKLPESVVNTPWSQVMRFTTSDGYIYLKHTPQLLALEAPILQLLRHQHAASVPEVIAHHAKLHCFLMHDAGTNLRSILKRQFDTDLFCRAIKQFTCMQLAVADYIDSFINIGVPDWRLEKIPSLYQQLLSQKTLLIADGLSENEINQLQKMLPDVVDLCSKLCNYEIKASIVQPDFHDNNILVDDQLQKITFIDLGEIVISHPFFSLAGCLRQTKKHYALQDKDPSYLQLTNACLNHYLDFAAKKDLLDALAIADRLWFIYAALSYARLIHACDKHQLGSYYKTGRLSGPLRSYLQSFNVL